MLDGGTKDCPLFVLGGSAEIRIGPQHVQKRVGVWMVRRIPRVMAKADAAGGIDDENSGKLHHITLGDPHAVAFGQGHKSFHGQPHRQHRGRGHLFEIEIAEKALFPIGNHGKGNLELLLEVCNFFRGSKSDQHHLSAEALKLIFSSAQLRHLLPAKRSPVMTEKNQHQRPALPESAESGHRVVPQHDIAVFDFGPIHRHGISFFCHRGNQLIRLT